MRRSTLALALIPALALAIGGCADADDEPSATSTAPDTAEPSTEAPETSPEPSPESSASDTTAPQCADEYVLALNAGGTVGYTGTDDAILAAASPTIAFAEPAALDGLDVLCTVTILSPIDGADGTVAVSIAFVGPDPAPVPALEAWATEAGYVADDGSVPAEWYQPRAAVGTTTQKVVWLTSADRGLDAADVAAEAEQTGVAIDMDTIQVIHYDFAVGG